jgi:uncharacterized circularly permuted ATP-grasp superfamily protein/uncharacterized alpha-E superfamily protein
MQLELAMPRDGETDPGIAAFVDRYRSVPGVYDELIDPDGRVRPHWRSLLARLASFAPEERAARFAAADRHLSESGVVYRVYGEGGDVDRPWPLVHLPIVLDAADWERLALGVVQRARLFEAVIADLIGPARLVADGSVPAAVVAGSPEFLRPLAGVVPAAGTLHLYAADVGRAPDGRWWVLADRTQAPSGAGYAIENRIALSRALPELFDELRVERLGPFFQAMRAGLGEAAGRTDPRIALFTPGPWNETHFEHAFLARCLGFPLVEGGDLVASGAGVALRTVAGPQPVDLLVRRVDADSVDPLELDPTSRLGVPGLVEAVRNGRVTIANALGSGLVEAPALTGYLPGIARRLLGEDLLLPNVATWWCGDAAARRTVIDDLDRLVLVPAFGRSLPGVLDSAGVLGERLSPPDRRRLIDAIGRRGIDFVGREALRLSTAPILEDDRLVARPFAIRVFVARTPDGWMAMPGGLARFSDREDVRFLSMQRGGRSGDVWVIGADARERSGLRPIIEANVDDAARRDGALPARAADNLFWFGRYLERTEAGLRLVRALGRDDDGIAETSLGLARRIGRVLESWGAVDDAAAEPATLLAAALWGPAAGSITHLADEVRRTGAVVRDRLSPDIWRAVVDLGDRLHRPDGDARRDPSGEIGRALRTIAAITGLAQETMNRRDGWRFFDLGRRIERAVVLTRTARPALEDDDDEACDLLLDLVDGRLAPRLRRLSGPTRRPVLDLVLLDAADPRSVAFQIDRIAEHFDALAHRTGAPIPEGAHRIVDDLAALVGRGDDTLFDAPHVAAIEADLSTLSDIVTARWFGHAAPLAEPDQTEA